MKMSGRIIIVRSSIIKDHNHNNIDDNDNTNNNIQKPLVITITRTIMVISILIDSLKLPLWDKSAVGITTQLPQISMNFQILLFPAFS